MNINKQLSPAKNTPALQAKSSDALHIQRRGKTKELSSRKYGDLCRIVPSISCYSGVNVTKLLQV